MSPRRGKRTLLSATCLWLFATTGCATRPDDVTRLIPPLEEDEVALIRGEVEGRRAEIEIEGLQGPRKVHARIWAVGPDSLSYSPVGLHGGPYTVPLDDIALLAFPRSRWEIALEGAFRGAFDGALDEMYDGTLWARERGPFESRDYGRDLRSGALSGAATGLLFGLIGGDRDPPAFRFSPHGSR